MIDMDDIIILARLGVYVCGAIWFASNFGWGWGFDLW